MNSGRTDAVAADEVSPIVSVRADKVLAAQQHYLDALPLAAAIVGNDAGEIRIIACNVRYQKLEKSQPGRERAHVLDRLASFDLIENVLNGSSSAEKFVWRDGGAIDGRHFEVAMAPLKPSTFAGRRGLITLTDRTSEVHTEQSLRRQVLTDELSGLTNRIGFVDELDTRMAADGADNFAIVLVDLARFSRVNECIGTLGGDELIITVARRMISVMRGGDTLGRTGANEFAIAVHLRDGPGDVLHVARRVEAALAQPCRLSDFEIKIDCAIGCALAIDGGDDAEDLLRHAQLALKAAKRSKRTEVYQPSALDAARRRFAIETELRRAIERQELTLGYQPLMSLSTGKIAGFEALARWVHPDLGIVQPSEFITVAEDSGLIVPLGRWAMDEALRTLSAWDAKIGRALPIYVGVNLSAIQMSRDDVARSVGSALRTHGIAGQRLSIELTESAIVADPERAARTLEALKSHDTMITMDDFGTGYSNLASLQRMPIDSLKIDRSFVTDMLDDPDKVAIVRAVLSLAQALGMTTTAEGVETVELARTLAALGCTTGQGWHYAPALEADAALAYALNSLR